MKATVQYCLKNDILKEFLEAHAREVIGMNIFEWNLEDAVVVERKEGREGGREEGRVEGRVEGREVALLETARKLKSMGLSAEQIAVATGLSQDMLE
jgi:predicted transposase/invertase (TIGR01784 family)